MSEVVKIGYRGFGGFLGFSFLISFAIASLAFFVTGALMIAFSIFVVMEPSILQDISLNVFHTRIYDVGTAFGLIIFVGLLMILLGGVFLALTSYLAKTMFALDRELSLYVDKKVPKTGEVIDKLKDQKTDKLSELERLARLKESGVLSEEEFQQEKRLILKGKD